MGEGEPAPWLLSLVIEGIPKLFPQRISDSVSLLIRDKCVCKTALATLGVLNIAGSPVNMKSLVHKQPKTAKTGLWGLRENM